MACNGSTVSRATLHVTACLHSTGLLQPLTQAKTKHLLWACSQRKSQWSLPFTVRDAFRPSFSHSRRIQQQVGWGETQQKMTGDKLRVGKRAHIFSRPKAWESAPLYLCFSVSGRKSPSHKGGQVYWALDEIRKTVGCMWSKSEFCLSCDGFHASVSGGCSQALLVDLTPTDGPFKVGETRTRESKGKKATKRHKRQTDGDKKKEVLWCLVYIPQPSCLKYSKICNLYNHPVQIPANNPLSHKETAGQIPAQVLTSISSGDKWSKMAV